MSSKLGLIFKLLMHSPERKHLQTSLANQFQPPFPQGQLLQVQVLSFSQQNTGSLCENKIRFGWLLAVPTLGTSYRSHGSA